jgi:hypothetical protein
MTQRTRIMQMREATRPLVNVYTKFKFKVTLYRLYYSRKVCSCPMHSGSVSEMFFLIQTITNILLWKIQVVALHDLLN